MQRLWIGVAAAAVTLFASPAVATIAAVNPHSASYNGKFVVKARVMNYSNACYDGGVRVVTSCQVRFATPDDVKQHLCAKAAARATVGYWAPDAADPSKEIAVDLYWTGGGALEGSVIVPGTPAAYTMHIQLVDACGDMPSAIDTATLDAAGIDVGLGALLTPNYQFTGYVDAV